MDFIVIAGGWAFLLQLVVHDLLFLIVPSPFAAIPEVALKPAFLRFLQGKSTSALSDASAGIHTVRKGTLVRP